MLTLLRNDKVDLNFYVCYILGKRMDIVRCYMPQGAIILVPCRQRFNFWLLLNELCIYIYMNIHLDFTIQF